jgi:hypothetical protein
VIGKPIDAEMGSSGGVRVTMPMKNWTDGQNVLPAPLTPEVHDATSSVIVEAVGQALSADMDDIPIGAIPDILGKLETLRMKLWMRLNDHPHVSASVPTAPQSIAEQAEPQGCCRHDGHEREVSLSSLEAIFVCI